LVSNSCKAIASGWTVPERNRMPFGPSSVMDPFSPAGTDFAAISVSSSSSKVTRLPSFAPEREALARGLNLQADPESWLRNRRRSCFP
jgi:hypothetical protein